MPSAFPVKMFQQAELDNYKLQVELLQKKLERSEEQRQQMEDKFEKIQKKRNEHEKSMKTKSRIKFENFLEDQRERNERNKTIVKMLENIDQQASTLATRTERLKIMKLQYELYFAKLLQSHAMRSLQNSPRYSILPVNQIHQTQQSVVYPTMPMQTAGVTTIPINPQIQSTNIYQNTDNYGQQRIPTMTVGGSGVNIMGNSNSQQMTPIPVNYLHHAGNDIIYRYPNQMDYYNSGGQQLLLNPNIINQVPAQIPIGQTQLGLPIRSGTVPLMSPSDFHDSLNNPILALQQHNNNNNYPNQIHNQTQSRKPNYYSNKNDIFDGRNTNDRDELENIEDCKFYDQNTPMSDRDQLKLNQFRKLHENFKTNEKPLMHPQQSKNKNQFDFGKSQGDSDIDDDNDEPYKNNPDIFYRKDPISTKESTEKLLPINKTDNINNSNTIPNSAGNLVSTNANVMTDVNVKPVEKLRSMNLPIRITDGPKQKLNETDLISSELQPQLRQYQSFDKGRSISSQLEKNKSPIMWNGRNNPKLLSQPDQFARKEKISIENIENAIYGELINPEKQIQKNYMPMEPLKNQVRPEPLKNQVRPEPLNFKEIIERENYQIEKTDLNSEKVEAIDNSISLNKSDLISPKHQVIPNQNLNKTEINKDGNLYSEPISMPQNQQNIYNKTGNAAENLQIQQNISNEIPNTIQKVSSDSPIMKQNQNIPVEYGQNYTNQYLSEPTTNIQNSNLTTNDSTYDNYNNYQQEPESTAEYPQTETIVQNYETDLTQSIGQPVDVQENLEPTVINTVQNQDGYENQQYDPNYQYQADQNYPQVEYNEENQQQNPEGYPENYIQNDNTEYQNYPNQEYQGAYDPTTYDYNYEQQQNYQDPNQPYLTQEYDQNYQAPQVGAENYENYDQQQTNEIMDPTENISNTENYIQPTEILDQNPIVENPEINQPQLQSSVTSNLNEIQNPEDVSTSSPVTPPPPPPVKVSVKPILSKDKSVDLESKKKKKVNFVDSSETDSSSSAPKQDILPSNNDESDFDFSSTN